MENLVGKRLDGRYEIHEVIGVGGMAVVYRAYDQIDDRIVAIKVLKEEFSADDEFRRKFKNESKAIAILNHPNIVKVYDVSFGDRLQYIVMEYIDGITLKEYLHSQGTISWKEAVHFETQILKALQHAHDKGVVHRDIKPQNVVLLKDGSLKVTDFGIARFTRSETRTMTDSAIGSVHYISPEQARGDLVDEKADIYSAGVVLYELVTGKVPFEGDSAVSVAIQQLQKDAVMPRDINPEIPLGLEQITMKAMQKHPADRYRSAAEMLMDLSELVRNPNISFEYSYNSVDPIDAQATVSVDREALRRELEREGNHEFDEYDYDDYDSQKPKKTGKKDKKKKPGIIIGIVAAVLVVLGVVIAVFAGGKKVEVPNFVGLNYIEEIASNPDYSDFSFRVIDSEEYDSGKYDAGDVIEQNPDAGRKVKVGKVIVLTIAGSTSETVPDVTGKTVEEATLLLNQKGFVNITTVDDEDSDLDANKVTKSDPVAGSTVNTTETITLFVSKGSKFVDMPNVIGMSKAAAEKFLVDEGIVVKFVSKDSDKAKNQVIDQSVKEGDKVEKGKTVTLTISSGTPEEPVTQSPTTVTVTIDLPNTNSEAKLVAYLNNSKVFTDSILLNGSSYSFPVSGSDKKTIIVNIDGVQYCSATVDFSKSTISNISYS